MLKFESWPPEPGKVSFTEDVLAEMNIIELDKFYRRDVCIERVIQVGSLCASLLMQNTNTENANEIIDELACELDNQRTFYLNSRLTTIQDLFLDLTEIRSSALGARAASSTLNREVAHG